MSNNDNNDSRGLSGLANLGNTCYMNSTLQCLFATDLFNYYIKCRQFRNDLEHGIINLEVNKQKHILKLNPQITLDELVEFIKSKKVLLKEHFKNSITYTMYEVFTTMWNINCTIKPKKLKYTIGVHCPKFEGYDQHDSEELLYGLFDRIHNETKTDIKITKFKVPKSVSDYYDIKKKILKKIKLVDEDDKDILVSELNKLVVDNYDKDIIIRSIEYWKNYFEKNHSIISSIFTGMFLSEVQCTNCSNLNINFETFNILELSLVDKEGHIFKSIDECIKHFCEGELVEDYNCDN